MQLGLRKRRILAAVVERYVDSHEPVGSQALAAELDFGVRSATIRNEFAELEELQLLAQPHTSAGRVPTDYGYRVYVDELLQPRSLDSASQNALRSRLRPSHKAIEELLETACELLAQLTGYPAVISVPAVRRDSVKHVQLGSVDSRKILVVIYTASGHVEHRLFDVPHSVPPTRVVRAMRILNEKLRGRSIASIRQLSADDVVDPEDASDSFLRDALGYVKAILADQADDKVLVEGVVYILSQPEFADMEKARTVLRTFEESSLLHRVLDVPLRSNQATFVIGREHPARQMRELSFVGVPYRVGDATLGSVGVMGPTRMKYWNALPVVEQLSMRIGECLNEMIT